MEISKNLPKSICSSRNFLESIPLAIKGRAGEGLDGGRRWEVTGNRLKG
jgi:hypothetical protein